MAEAALLAPDPFGDLPFPEFQAPVDGDGFAFEDFDLEDLDLDVDFDLDLFASDGQLSQPLPPLATSSSSAGSPEGGSSSSGAGGELRNEESSESSSRSASGTDGSGKGKQGEEDEARRRARLVRNRESAHLSRQRKKQYVEELEGKVKAMQATIADLSARISCVTAENAALKQQLGGAGAVAGAAPPMPMPMYPAMYPLPVPWMHPAYPVRGSQVPLVPIPRLKPQQPAPAAAEPPAKKARKTKKVASVSLLGLLCLAMLCGCLIPAVNRMCGSVDAGEGAAFGPSHHGRILAVEGPRDNVSDGIDPKPPQSGSETLPALLYLPKNGKHVKINGNLVIKSIVASEKASLRLSGYDGKSPQNQKKEETSLAIPGYVTPLEAGEVRESTKGMMKNELMALAPADGTVYREDDGLLPQWFSEAMSGPLLSSGMCTEVFQFDVSPSSAHSNGITPIYSNAMSNSSQNFTQNIPSTHPRTVKNRRISYSEAIPLRGSTSNNTEHLKTAPKNESFGNTKPVSSVVVSVLADPREAGEVDVEGRISSKSLSRIFVVVLIDSVKYVTYSCVLPFKSHSPHL